MAAFAKHAQSSPRPACRRPSNWSSAATLKSRSRLRKPPVFMQPGDVFEVEIEGLGVLSNPFQDA
jgi:2-keto-4-pentenoate hydratase/2-oxohepta-3-ene-1,7-dioic acid hydratase in catechol pathway